MSATKILLTAEEFDNYPFEEDKRYELDEGELIEMTRPAYRHNRVLRKLLVRLDNFLGKDATWRSPYFRKTCMLLHLRHAERRIWR